MVGKVRKSVRKCRKVPKRCCLLVVALYFFSDVYGLKPLLFPPLLNKVQNSGTQGAKTRYTVELPPFSIVRHPGRPVMLVVEES